MATARVVTMMAIVAVGAGALLAISTIPAIAPYQQHKPNRAASLAPLPGPEIEREQAPAYDLAPAPMQERSDDSIALGSQDGRLVLELPRWVEDREGWVTLGRRAWRDWVEPEYEPDESDQRGYAPRDRRSWDKRADDSEPGYGARHERPARRWYEDEEGDAYGESWSQPIEPPLASAAPYVAQRPESGFGPERQERPAADGAARAAARARQAARDVRAAEGAVQ